jgi:hypothetical protein
MGRLSLVSLDDGFGECGSLCYKGVLEASELGTLLVQSRLEVLQKGTVEHRFMKVGQVNSRLCECAFV